MPRCVLDGLLMDGRSDRVPVGILLDSQRLAPPRPLGSHLLNAGTDDLSLVQEARGYRDIRTTQIYTVMKVNPRLFRAVEKAFKRNS
jgi:hypothetical protein